MPQHRRRWSKTDATQQRILSAATVVFRERGYSAATMGEVVSTSGASIGSIYHHFGGKNELFLAIHDHMAAVIEAQIADAEQSFDAQTRAYLQTVWDYRDTAVVLSSDDVPPGFEQVYRDGIRVWFREWLAEFDIDASASGRLLSRAIVTLLTDSSAMLMACESDADAEPVIEAAIALINRLTG